MAPIRIRDGQSLGAACTCRLLRFLSAIGVSGGPDSVALMLLLQRWAAPRKVRLLGITIDHHFREESAEECVVRIAWFA